MLPDARGKAAGNGGLSSLLSGPGDCAILSPRMPSRIPERKIAMTNKVLLNNIDHADLRAVTRHGAEFGDSVNQLLVFPTEFEELQREFPIFFRRNPEGGFQAVALLGFDRDENLFLEGEAWTSRYVPAIQRRGPFSIAMQNRQEHGETRPEAMIHVDLDDPRVGESEGEPLFLRHGGNAPCLERIAAVLRAIHQGLEASRPLFAAFEAAGILSPVELEIELSETSAYKVPDLFAIDEERLAALGAERLADLHRAGFLRAAFMAAASVGNVARLIELKNRRLAGAAAR